MAAQKSRRGSESALFRGLDAGRSVTLDTVYKIVRGYSAALGFEIDALSVRVPSRINAHDHEVDITNAPK